VILLFKLFLGLVPVFIFLASLVYLDSYKLVTLRTTIFTILVGCAVAGIGLAINSSLLGEIGDTKSYSRYIAPFIEEALKGAYILYLVYSRRVGFMVDAAVTGFALGAGFAFVENVYYLYHLPDSNLALWFVRGFGTAAMHGGTTAMVGILAKVFYDRNPNRYLLVIFAGLAPAIALHSLFNHFILPPLWSTLVILAVFPALLVVIFEKSEQATRDWLGEGLDADMELLDLILTGKISETRIGQYLESLRDRFEATVVADMLCLLRLHAELALQAKGMLLSQQAGLQISPDPELEAKLAEMSYLEQSIGKTGKLAIHPFLRGGTREIFQIKLLLSQQQKKA
jgi:RsiW-degrading membrane proteinase PrsW (M82 family)